MASTTACSGMRWGELIALTSTAGPHAARDIAAQAALVDVRFLDAPVSGSMALAGPGPDKDYTAITTLRRVG